MALLDIIITHWKEPWSDGRKMFEMLRIQRGVNDGEFRVILVQDGPEGGLDLDRIARVYPFVEQVIEIAPGGVSAARNAGLDSAESPWVMFCDFDDVLYSVDSLHRILESIRQAGDRGDLLWSDIWIEVRTPDGKFRKVSKGWNSVFIHGKVYRREFLLSRGIRFQEDLTYSEDAMFNVLVAMECDAARVGHMPETVYMWCYRPESLSNYTGGDATRNASLYKKRIRTIAEYEKRSLDYDADTACARTVMDYYWEICGQDRLAGHSREEWIAMLREDVVTRRPGFLRRVSPKDLAELRRVTHAEAEAKGLIRKEMETMDAWLEEIGAR